MTNIYFIKEENESIKEYELSFDKEKLEKVKEMASKLIVKKHKSVEIEGSIPQKMIEADNFKAEFKYFKRMDCKIYDEEVPVIQVDYDEIIYEPKLIKIIDRLINHNDASVLSDLEEYKKEIDSKLENIKKESQQYFEIHSKKSEENQALCFRTEILAKIYECELMWKHYVDERDYISIANSLLDIKEKRKLDFETYITLKYTNRDMK